VCRNNSGFTLIEFLVAIVILMVGMLALLQTINLAINHNLQNQYRNEAAVIADSEMAVMLAKGFERVSTSTMQALRLKSYSSGFTLRNYSVVRTGTTYSNSKEVTYRVSWRYRGGKYEQGITSVITKNE